MDQNPNPSPSNRDPEQPPRHHEQPQGGGPPPQAQPPQERQQPPGQSPPPRGGQFQPPEQGMPPQGGTSGQQPPRQQPPQQRPPQQPPQQQPPRQGMQSQQGMEIQSGQGTGMAPQQGMGMQSQQGMPPQGAMQGQMGGQRKLPVEPVGAEHVSPDDVVTGSRDEPVTSLVEKMAQADVGTVVITEDRRPVGLVTDRKIAMSLMENPDVSELTAGDVMTEDPITVSRDTTIFDVIRTLGDSGIRRAPVVDDEGNLAGIVSSDDAIVLLAEELNQVSNIVQQQIDRF